MPEIFSNVVLEKVVLAVEQTVYIQDNILTIASRLVDDLKLGKFARIRLAISLEETFDLEIPDEVVKRFTTVGDIVQYMSRWSPEGANNSIYQPAQAYR